MAASGYKSVKLTNIYTWTLSSCWQNALHNNRCKTHQEFHWSFATICYSSFCPCILTHIFTSIQAVYLHLFTFPFTVTHRSIFTSIEGSFEWGLVQNTENKPTSLHYRSLLPCLKMFQNLCKYNEVWYDTPASLNT